MRIICAALLPALLIAAAACAADEPASFIYDVTPDGTVHVTIEPSGAGTLMLPVTAEKLEAVGLDVETTDNWETYTRQVKVTRSGDGSVLTYDWPDGALPWPVKEDRWFTDSFQITGPAEVTILLPPRAEVREIKDQGCTAASATDKDERVAVTFGVPKDRTVREMGVVYTFPWADGYAVFGEPPVPVHYPKALAGHREYMERVEHFHTACREFYDNYKAKLGYAPDQVEQFLISWLQGYGGAYCAGNNCYFPYRRVAAFEYPPVTSGDRLIGAYHEMAHAFQPAGYPGFLGGHVWTRLLTMDYDWNVWPTLAQAEARKNKGGTAGDEMRAAYAQYVRLYDQGLLPGLWDDWPGEGMHGSLQEAAQAYALLQIARDFGWTFWGDFARAFERSSISYDGLPNAVQQRIAVAQMSAAAGQDLSRYLAGLTRCDFSTDFQVDGTNLAANGGMEDDAGWALDAYAPTAALAWDEDVHCEGARSARLECTEPNDARLVQQVAVEPVTCYLLTARVKTRDVGTNAVGATVCTMNVGTHSKDLTGTNDWTTLALPLYSGDAEELTIALRLGFYGSVNTGTVWFDQVELVPLLSIRGWQRLVDLSKPPAED